MIRGKKNGLHWRKALALLLVLWFVLSVAGTAVFFTVFFGRYDRAPAGSDVFSNAQAVRFPSGDDLLHGWIVPADPAPDPQGIAVLLHGFHAGAADLAGLVPVFTRSGWDVLCFDGTGTGESEGNGVKSLQQRVIDTRAALSMLKTGRYAGTPVLLVGHSAGGWAAAMLSAEESVSAVICINAFESVLDLMLDTAVRHVGPVAYTGAPFLAGGLWLQNGDLAFQKASDAVHAAAVPVLIIQSGLDTTVPEARSLAGALQGRPAPQALICPVADAGHSDLLPSADGTPSAQARALTDAIETFLSRSFGQE